MVEGTETHSSIVAWKIAQMSLEGYNPRGLDIKATLTAKAAAQQTKVNDVLKPQEKINVLKR